MFPCITKSQVQGKSIALRYEAHKNKISWSNTKNKDWQNIYYLIKNGKENILISTSEILFADQIIYFHFCF